MAKYTYLPTQFFSFLSILQFFHTHNHSQMLLIIFTHSSTTVVVIFLIQQIFLSPQVKQVIISNKVVYTSCLTSCRTTLDLKIRKVQNNVKISWNDNLMPSPPSKKKILLVQAKDSFKIEILLFPQCAISHENQNFSQMFCLWLQLL